MWFAVAEAILVRDLAELVKGVSDIAKLPEAQLAKCLRICPPQLSSAWFTKSTWSAMECL